MNSKKKPDGQYNGYGFHNGPVPLRSLVKVHPETGRKNLVIGRHAHNIPGMDKQKSERFLQSLTDFATGEPRRVYHHDWKPGDAVLWDNRRLMHRATPWDYTQRRIMWHSRLAGDPGARPRSTTKRKKRPLRSSVVLSAAKDLASASEGLCVLRARSFAALRTTG